MRVDHLSTGNLYSRISSKSQRGIYGHSARVQFRQRAQLEGGQTASPIGCQKENTPAVHQAPQRFPGVVQELGGRGRARDRAWTPTLTGRACCRPAPRGAAGLPPRPGVLRLGLGNLLGASSLGTLTNRGFRCPSPARWKLATLNVLRHEFINGGGIHPIQER
jgi:hypothetical protein